MSAVPSCRLDLPVDGAGGASDSGRIVRIGAGLEAAVQPLYCSGAATTAQFRAVGVAPGRHRSGSCGGPRYAGYSPQVRMLVAGQGDGVLHPGRGGGTRDGGGCSTAEVGHGTLALAAVVVIRCIPGGRRRCAAPPIIPSRHPVPGYLLEAQRPWVLGVLQHRIGVGATDPGHPGQNSRH